MPSSTSLLAAPPEASPSHSSASQELGRCESRCDDRDEKPEHRSQRVKSLYRPFIRCERWIRSGCVRINISSRRIARPLLRCGRRFSAAKARIAPPYHARPPLSSLHSSLNEIAKHQKSRSMNTPRPPNPTQNHSTHPLNLLQHYFSTLGTTRRSLPSCQIHPPFPCAAPSPTTLMKLPPQNSYPNPLYHRPQCNFAVRRPAQKSKARGRMTPPSKGPDVRLRMAHSYVYVLICPRRPSHHDILFQVKRTVQNSGLALLPHPLSTNFTSRKHRAEDTC